MNSPLLARSLTRLLAVVTIPYLLGSIPTGYWLGKWWKGVDVRRHGSGNFGATNVFRVLGKVPGSITLCADILKGAAPVLAAQKLFPDSIALALAAGLAAILGHTLSIFMGFRGGKGVATAAGAFAALLPLPSGIAFVTFMVCLALTRFVSVSSMLGSLALAAAALTTSTVPLLSYAAAAVACLVIWKHRGNLRRLRQGTEPRVAWRKHAAPG